MVQPMARVLSRISSFQRAAQRPAEAGCRAAARMVRLMVWDVMRYVMWDGQSSSYGTLHAHIGSRRHMETTSRCLLHRIRN